MFITDSILVNVLAEYNQPGRGYHGPSHPLEMIFLHYSGATRGIRIDGYACPDFGDHNTALIQAIYAHDCVYDVGVPKGVNERNSYHRWVEITGIDDPVIKSLVVVTVNHQPYQLLDAGLVAPELMPILCHMSDLDMAPLAMSEDEFRRNTDAITFENLGKYTMEEIEAGRKAFYRSLLDQKRIFHTDQFHNNLEHLARANLERGLA